VESEPDALHLDTSTSAAPTPTIVAITAQAPEVQEDRLDTTVIPGALNAELEQETLTVSSPSAQETGVDVVSSSVVAHDIGTEMKVETHGTDATTTKNDLSAAEFPAAEQPVMLTTEVIIFYSCGTRWLTLFYLERVTLSDM
jgi:hypothetical protein